VAFIELNLSVKGFFYQIKICFYRKEVAKCVHWNKVKALAVKTIELGEKR
jgi:hypothetical protein